MHFHLTRGQLLNEIVARYQFSLADAQRVFDFLENSGKVTFAGAMFLVNEPYSQDAVGILELARASLGHAAGGAVSFYKVKEFLEISLRQAQQYGAKRSTTAA